MKRMIINENKTVKRSNAKKSCDKRFFHFSIEKRRTYHNFCCFAIVCPWDNEAVWVRGPCPRLLSMVGESFTNGVYVACSRL